MNFLKNVLAFIKTPKFWVWFAAITVADYLFLNKKLSVVPLIPELYKFYDMVGLNKVKDLFKKEEPPPTKDPKPKEKGDPNDLIVKDSLD
jgi:hypothetical protein